MKRVTEIGFALGLPAFFLAGCSLAPDYERPEMELPKTLDEGEAGGVREEARIAEQWWLAFDAPELDQWVERVLEANTDLAQAAARIEQARAQLGLGRAALFPDLGVEGQAARSRSSAAETLPGQENPGNRFTFSGLLSYEFDLFGRLRNARDAAREELLATAYGFHALRNALAAETAILWFNLQASAEQLAFAEDTVRSRERGLELQQTRYDAGIITQLERQQAAAELADAQVQIPVLRRSLHELQTALLVLAGYEAAALWQREDITLRDPDLPEPPTIPLDLMPASLLERRPDVAAAEAQLRAAYERIGVARAQRWPMLSLSALYGTSAGEIDSLFGQSTQAWSLAGTAAAPIYDFGRTRNRVNLAEAARDEMSWNYRAVVLEAFGEVADAVALLRFTGDSLEARQRQQQAFARTLELARQRYQDGYTDYLDVLDAERRHFNAGLAVVDARLERLVASVQLYRALGGGWNGEPVSASRNAGD